VVDFPDRVSDQELMPAPDLSLGPMSRDEADILAGWAADEGWNPGKADIAIAWDTDPEAFIALRKGSDLVGGGTIISYGSLYGFMGLFIVRRDQRGDGIGGQLWRFRLKRLQDRLAPGAAIGMDGVFAMVPFYERGGFVFAHNEVRYEGLARGTLDPKVRRLDPTMFDQIDRFDRAFVPAKRSSFLQRWIFQPGAHAVGLTEKDQLVGYGVARPARTGFKVGPVFAQRPDIAERLVSSLLAYIPGQQVQIDVPEPNQAGTDLVKGFGLREVFGCARMYHGAKPNLPIENIYGVTSFEFG
jgi:GNAT superfamily N-acetyltransferase